MEKSYVENKLSDIIKSSMNIDFANEDIIGENLILECGINSIDALEIFLNIENEFNIFIEDEDLSSQLLSSLQKLSEYVIRKQALNG